MIGIFGGTFDPVHYGHLRSAYEIGELFQLSEVRLVPSSAPPHRAQPEASAAQRLEMLELALGSRKGLGIDTRELERAGHSFMVDTLESLRMDFPDQLLLLIIGCDAFNGLPGWHQWRRLFEYAHIAVMTRPGFVPETRDDFFCGRIASEKGQLRDAPAGKILFQPVTQLDISATAIRQMLREKRDPVFLLPDAVLEYIQCNGLYETS
ncbi:MAG: nicotinate-nucleotide adenylyltransferase [Gammaproteobacteria bacterium]